MPRLSPSLLWLVLSWGLASCGDQGPTPSGVSGVYITGLVQDPDGHPVPLITVVWEAWPAPDSAPGVLVSDFGGRGFVRTDSVGRFAAQVGDSSVARLDSLEVGVGGQKCWGLAPKTVRERGITVTPGTPDTVRRLSFTLDRSSPRARLAVGPACAVVVGPPPFQSEDVIMLWIDQTGEPVRGRWLINYQDTRGDDYGEFTGSRVGDGLTLELLHASPWDTESPLGVCTGYTLELPIEPGDTLGAGTYGSENCPYTPAQLRFVQEEARTWPF
jgi:hypothetical protein